ncbi:cupredoxin domain-containing protein [Haloarcula sp. GH36]|uniref:cupredoxin domain-containing protein n=1 Tax=Haloarcula montana TaxID=3111776 RepID=UPI002D77A2D1|nr:plastocyanin/azurin family copper-binding protein [Haloarcula sp. GH36]
MSYPQLTRRKLLEGTAGLAVAGLAGCSAPSGSAQQQAGGDDHPGHGQEEPGHDTVSEPAASREVVVNTARSEGSTEYHFDPHVTWVEVGGTVTWRLESGSHTTTAYHPDNDQPRLVPEGAAAWDSGTMSEEGETFEHTFETPGVYHYLCTPHESLGMIATVIVGDPHLEDQRALQTMPENKSEEVQGKLEELNTIVRDIMSDDQHEEETHSDDGHGHDEATHTETDQHAEETDAHHDEETHT